MEINSPKYCTYRGHEGGGCTNILSPMDGVVYKCNTIKLFHFPLCPGNRRGMGGVFATNRSIASWLFYNISGFLFGF